MWGAAQRVWAVRELTPRPTAVTNTARRRVGAECTPRAVHPLRTAACTPAGANNKLPEEGLLKKSKQMKSDGTRYAPWMVRHAPVSP